MSELRSGADVPDASDFFSRFDAPALIVTARSEGDASGCLVAFATQCSIYPPRLLVCLSALNKTTALASTASVVGVHLLGEAQFDLAALFGATTGDELDKLSKVSWHPGPAGAPILDECAAWFEGVVVGRIPMGDHVGHVLDVAEVGSGPSRGTLLRSAVTRLDAGHPAEEIREPNERAAERLG